MAVRDAIKAVIDNIAGDRAFQSHAPQFEPDRTPADHARQCASENTVFPALLFLEWVDRTPEARDAMAKAGMYWEGWSKERPTPRPVAIGADGPEASIPDELAGAGTKYELNPGKTIRVNTESGYQWAHFIGNVGGLLRFQILGSDSFRAFLASASAIHPDDRDKFDLIFSAFQSASKEAGGGQTPEPLKKSQVVEPKPPPRRRKK